VKTPTSAIGTSCERGLTLLELLVVIVLLGFLAAIGAQAIPGDARRLQRVSEFVELQLRKARLNAMKSGVAEFLPCTTLGSRQGKAEASKRDAGLTVACAGVKGSARGIIFFADGSSSGETIELVSGQAYIRIGVDALTGAVSVE